MFFILFFISQVFSFNLNQANISVFLSAAAYCPKENYKTMNVGINVTDVIYDKKTDMQGYVGINDPFIYVVFRGSDSIDNWIQDLDVIKTNYTSYYDCKCLVHTGFYETALNVKDQVINAIDRILGRYDDKYIIVTGHSLGAAISNFISMELIKYYSNVELYSFGQPKCGDEIYANFFNKKMNVRSNRITHYNDVVPHLPEINYYHSRHEIYEDENHKLTDCYDNDPNCSEQFKLYQTSVSSHMNYLSQDMHCNV